MTAAYLLLSTLAALGFYLASAHQRLWPPARQHARTSRATAWVFVALAMATASVAHGTWAGVFAASTAIMLAMVLLPYLDAWRRTRRNPVQEATSDVG